MKMMRLLYICLVFILFHGLLYAKEKISLPAKVQITSDFVRVHIKPDLNSQIKGVLYKRMIVTAHERTKGKMKIEKIDDYWYKIKLDNINGWVYENFLDFTLKQSNLNTYYGGTNFEWFYKRYGAKTWKINVYNVIDVNSFNLDEYRSLLTAVEEKRQGEAPILALEYSIYQHLYKNPGDLTYNYLKKKIYSTEFIFIALRSTHDNILLTYIPSECLNDKKEIIKLAQSGYYNDSFIEKLPENLKHDTEFIKNLIRVNVHYIDIIPQCNIKLDKKFALEIITNIPYASIYYYLSDDLKNDQDIAIQTVSMNCGLVYYLPSKLKDDEIILKAALNSRTRSKIGKLYIIQNFSERLQNKYLITK